jgi:uncharacterized protein (DUF1330 family)
MPLTVIAQVTFNEDNPQALAKYLDATTPLLESVNARITNRFRISESVVGESLSEWVLLVEYPDRAAVNSVFNSIEYQEIIPIRDQAFLSYQVSLVSRDHDVVEDLS